MTEFLQSSAWKKFQDARGRVSYEASGEGWHYLAIHEPTRAGLRIYTPGGPLASDEASLQSALAHLVAYAKQQGAYVVRVEPDVKNTPLPSYLRKRGYRRAHKDINPAHTILNDVAQSIEDIDAGASSTVRNIWRKNIKEGVTFSVSYDPSSIELFIEMIHDVSKRTSMQPHPDSYFRTLATSLFPSRDAGLLVASEDGTPVATVIFYVGETSYIYAHAASYTAYRKNLSPATALALYSLHQAHDLGKREFDFFGSAPEDAPANHPWQGFTRFKKSFGGQIVARSGTWELPLKRGRSLFMNTAARLYNASAKLRRK